MGVRARQRRANRRAAKAVAMHADGELVADIARTLGVSRRQIYQYLNADKAAQAGHNDGGRPVPAHGENTT